MGGGGEGGVGTKFPISPSPPPAASPCLLLPHAAKEDAVTALHGLPPLAPVPINACTTRQCILQSCRSKAVLVVLQRSSFQDFSFVSVGSHCCQSGKTCRHVHKLLWSCSHVSCLCVTCASALCTFRISSVFRLRWFQGFKGLVCCTCCLQTLHSLFSMANSAPSGTLLPEMLLI